MELLYSWILAWCVTTALGVSYSDLVTLDASCSPSDTCKRPVGYTGRTNCQCDGRNCLLYDDCCVDGPKPTRRNRPRKPEYIKCVPFTREDGVYGIATCSPEWNGPDDTKSKCENKDDLSDLVMAAPLTDGQKSITYRNHYCAVCNNAVPEDLILWNVKLTCPSLTKLHSTYGNITQEFMQKNLLRVDNFWGVYHWDQVAGERRFFPCNLTFSIPAPAQNLVRHCTPHTVSTCASDWNRGSGHRDCASYMAVIYINGQAYRNAHCALCNHIPLDDPKCSPEEAGGISSWVNFRIVLQSYRKDSAEESAQSKCATGQVYDPRADKCRRLKCRSPGYVVKDGECVKE